MSATTNLLAPVTPLAPPMSRMRAVSQLRDSLRRAWSHAKRPQKDDQVTSIAKGMLTSERFKGLDHVVAMQFDALEREAPIEVVEEFWNLGATIARAKHASVTGGDPEQGATFSALLLAERRAHGEHETAFARFVEEKSYANAQQLFGAACLHEHAERQLLEFVRRKAAECQGSTLTMSHAG